jgi:hypothetical protein
MNNNPMLSSNQKQFPIEGLAIVMIAFLNKIVKNEGKLVQYS